MRRAAVKNFFLICQVLIVCGSGLAQEFMPVDSVRPGMKGTFKTVFSGTRVEEFGVEILGVLKKATVKGDIILARLSGGPLGETGIVSGMSGSPVYVDGKLVGAIAYRWGAFAKEPICGITPVFEMLEVFSEGTSQAPELDAPSKDLALPSEQGLGPFSGRALVPIASPLYISGFDERTVHHIQAFLERFNLVPVPGGGHLAETSKEGHALEPGSCLGVQVMNGDANLTAMGTLTYIDGKRVLAFGHPMFYAGSTELPMTGGFIHSVLPSQYASFKIASPTGIVGTIQEDWRQGIGGTIARVPKLLPLEISVDGNPFSFRLVKERALAPTLAGWATFNSIVASAGLSGDLTASTRLQIHLQGHPLLSVEDLTSDANTPLAVAQRVDKLLEELLGNKFEEVSLERVELSVSLTHEKLTAEIEGVTLGAHRLSPGDTLELLISLRSYQGSSIAEKAKIPIPKGTQEGNYTLRVVDGSKYLEEERKRAPLRLEPQSLLQFLSLIEESPKGDEIFCQLYADSPGATIGGEELPSLPPSVISTMKSSKQSGGESLTRSSLVAEKRVKTEFLVTGREEIAFRISRR